MEVSITTLTRRKNGSIGRKEDVKACETLRIGRGAENEIFLLEFLTLGESTKGIQNPHQKTKNKKTKDATSCDALLQNAAEKRIFATFAVNNWKKRTITSTTVALAVRSEPPARTNRKPQKRRSRSMSSNSKLHLFFEFKMFSS